MYQGRWERMAPSVVPFIRVMAHSTKLFVITVLYVVVAPIFPLFILFIFLLPLGELLLATLSQSFYFFSFVFSSGRIRIYQEAIDDET